MNRSVATLAPRDPAVPGASAASARPRAVERGTGSSTTSRRVIPVRIPPILLAVAGWALLQGVPARPAAAPGGVPANRWFKQQRAMIGPDAPIAVVWPPRVKRFMSLGWISGAYDKRAPYTYDELAFDPASGRWENWFPEGKGWGPKFGPCKPPGWKQLFEDAEGNTRPNWPAYYWLLGAASNCAYLPEDGTYLFYINGHTFTYDPVKRAWKDLAAKGDPQNSTKLKSQIFWGSICYHEANKQVVLFGGGNADTERGDPGTWIYTPATNTWSECKLDRQPPPRANSQLAYDPVSKKVVLFGGDQLDQTVADTWTFDGTQWTQKKPALTPSPRAGHALLWLPKAKKLLLLGGYTVNSTADYAAFPYRNVPLEAWTYDEKADAWQFIKRFEPARDNPVGPRHRVFARPSPPTTRWRCVDAARKLWLCKLDASAPDAAGTRKHGVGPGAVERRNGPYDPAWYSQSVPAADPAKVKADLENLPANKWCLRPTPKRPAPNMDWGTAVFGAGSGFDPALFGRPLGLQWHGTANLRHQDRPLLHPVRSRDADRLVLQQRPGAGRVELQGQPLDDRPHLQVHGLRPEPEVHGLRPARVHVFPGSQDRQVDPQS